MSQSVCSDQMEVYLLPESTFKKAGRTLCVWISLKKKRQSLIKEGSGDDLSRNVKINTKVYWSYCLLW